MIDYRALNEVTIGDASPLPNIEEILEQLGGAKYFSTLDCVSGFHQVKMHPRDAPKTAFSVPEGHFEFTRMPFGLKKSPATFQRLMRIALTGLINNFRCLVYIDDIIVTSDTLENHVKTLKEVFRRLSLHNLKLEPKKCFFLRREVIYLGQLITEDGLKPDPIKIKCVQDFPTPTSQKEVKSFLGLAGYYRRFIPDFSKIAYPIVKLLKKNAPFDWTDLQKEVFKTLKEKLCSEPVLQYLNFNEEFTLTTDASGYATGTVLSQGPKNRNLPLAYFSRTLNKAEQNYDTSSRELLAIVSAIKHFRPYLFGRRFKIVTDNIALQ